MSVTSSRLRAKVALQAVATMEKFADVSANIVLENEAATRVLINKFANIKHQIV